MPRTTLADRSSVTASAITQYERGQARPTAPVLAELSLALGVPADFFRHGTPVRPVAQSAAHFRSLRSTPALVRDQAIAFAELALLTIDVIEQYVDLPLVNLPEVGVLADGDPAEVADAARRTRSHFGLAPGPVGNVVQLLEAHGVLVLRMADAVVDSRVDAFSTQATRRPLVLLSPVKDDKARSRFDAAHELGHLIMHHDVEPGSKLVEGQAQAFAAEFLMPAAEVVDDLPRRVDWQQLHLAKRKWGTSLRALAYRARALGVWSETSYRRANIELSQQGNPEAGPLGPAESPTVIGRALTLLEGSRVDVEALAQMCRVPIDLVQEVILAGSALRLEVGGEAAGRALSVRA